MFCASTGRHHSGTLLTATGDVASVTWLQCIDEVHLCPSAWRSGIARRRLCVLQEQLFSSLSEVGPPTISAAVSGWLPPKGPEAAAAVAAARGSFAALHRAGAFGTVETHTSPRDLFSLVRAHSAPTMTQNVLKVRQPQQRACCVLRAVCCERHQGGTSSTTCHVMADSLLWAAAGPAWGDLPGNRCSRRFQHKAVQLRCWGLRSTLPAVPCLAAARARIRVNSCHTLVVATSGPTSATAVPPAGAAWLHLSQGCAPGAMRPVLDHRASSDRTNIIFFYLIFRSGAPTNSNHDPTLHAAPGLACARFSASV